MGLFMLPRFLSRLYPFKKRSKQSSTINNDPNPATINDSSKRRDYNPELITNLINEHKDILNISNSIVAAAQKQKWAVVQNDLAHLAALLDQHMNAETKTLYQILEHIHAPASLEVEMIQFIRQEMSEIGHDLLNFIHQYNELNPKEIRLNVFLYEYKKLLFTLTARIELEESTLYPLYEILLHQKK